MPLLGQHSVGHASLGGSVGFADPEAGIAFGYVPNRVSSDLKDPRALRIIVSIGECPA
jgi:hypothetical protein